MENGSTIQKNCFGKNIIFVCVKISPGIPFQNTQCLPRPEAQGHYVARSNVACPNVARPKVAILIVARP
jgi:hypothetical protein